MVIDDDHAITNLLSTLLKKYHYTPITACNGSVALDTLKYCLLPTLILTDYCMPVLNGCELVEALSRQPAYRDIPVIMFTGSSIEDLQLPRTSNFKGIIQKPFELSSILDAINI